MQSGSHNTAMLHHQKHTYALVEVTHPLGIKVDLDSGVDMRVKDHDTFDGELKHGFTAHPKVDKSTGELLVSAWSIKSPTFTYSLIDANRKLVTSFKVPIASQRMIHDFCVSKNYIIVPDLPLELNGKNAIQNMRTVFDFNKKAKARYGLLKRRAKDASEIQWFDLAPEDVHFCFHFANAYEICENGHDIVVMHCCAWKDFEFFEPEDEHPLQKLEDWYLQFREFRFNLSTGEYLMENLIADVNCEFPCINPDYAANRAHQFVYVATMSAEEYRELSPKAKENIQWSGFIKYDVKAKRIVNQVSYGGEKMAGEVIFHPRKNAKSEDDGYLMTFVYDPHGEKSEYCLWDAKDCELVMKFDTNQRVPFGFHGIFVDEEDLEK